MKPQRPQCLPFGRASRFKRNTLCPSEAGAMLGEDPILRSVNH
jgi:hypothetical protein